MSQAPKKKKTNRRLSIEMMETRLMLSVSPTGSLDTKDLTDVEFVPPPTQGAGQLDMIDFADMAAQFNGAYLQEQINNAAPIRQLPDADTGALELSEPSTFLSASTNSTGQTADTFSERLSSEYTSIAWTTSPPTVESTDQDASSPALPQLPLPGTDAPAFDSDPSEDEAYFADPAARYFREITNGGRAEKSSEDDFTQYDRDWGPFDDKLDSWFEFGVNPSDAGDRYIIVSSDNLDIISFDTMRQMEMIDIEGLFMGSYNDPNATASLLDGLAPDGVYSAWLAMPQSGDPLNINHGNHGDQENAQAPPMPHLPGAYDALLATANTLYQDTDRNDMESNATSWQNLTNSIYSSSQNAYYSFQSINEEGTYEESPSLSDLGGGDGTAFQNNATEFSFLENGIDLESDNLEIEGVMNTDPQMLQVDANSNTGENGGIIDFTNAMTWSQKPVKANAEGIVEASVQQDHQVAFEGSYGQGQTFELATAEDAEPTTSETLTPEDVSAALLEKLNNLPLNDKAQENLDETNLTPTAHEMALEEMNQEMDYASFLPSDALSWATFAMVGQTAVRHPQDQKKKKHEKSEPEKP